MQQCSNLDLYYGRVSGRGGLNFENRVTNHMHLKKIRTPCQDCKEEVMMGRFLSSQTTSSGRKWHILCKVAHGIMTHYQKTSEKQKSIYFSVNPYAALHFILCYISK